MSLEFEAKGAGGCAGFVALVALLVLVGWVARGWYEAAGAP